MQEVVKEDIAGQGGAENKEASPPSTLNPEDIAAGEFPVTNA